jgi:hypothetical protein
LVVADGRFFEHIGSTLASLFDELGETDDVGLASC